MADVSGYPPNLIKIEGLTSVKEVTNGEDRVKTNANQLYATLGTNYREELVRIMREWEL